MTRLCLAESCLAESRTSQPSLHCTGPYAPSIGWAKHQASANNPGGLGLELQDTGQSAHPRFSAIFCAADLAATMQAIVLPRC